MGCIDIECAGLGIELGVQRGGYGSPIQSGRATVGRSPHCTEGRNGGVEVGAARRRE